MTSIGLLSPNRVESPMDKIIKSKLKLLQSENKNLKSTLKRICDQYSLPADLVFELTTLAELPDICQSDRGSTGHGLDVIKQSSKYMNEEESTLFLDKPLPSERNNVLFNQFGEGQDGSVFEKILFADNNNASSMIGNGLIGNGISGNDLTTNHDFLAQIPLSPKLSGEGSEDNVSDLSSSFWSARVLTAESFETTHHKHKRIVPLLDFDHVKHTSESEGAENCTLEHYQPPEAEDKEFEEIDL